MAESAIEYTLTKRSSTRFKSFSILLGLLAIAFFAAFLAVLIVYLTDKDEVSVEEFSIEDSSHAQSKPTTTTPSPSGPEYWRYKLPKTASPNHYDLHIAVTLPCNESDTYQNITSAPEPTPNGAFVSF